MYNDPEDFNKCMKESCDVRGVSFEVLIQLLTSHMMGEQTKNTPPIQSIVKEMITRLTIAKEKLKIVDRSKIQLDRLSGVHKQQVENTLRQMDQRAVNNYSDPVRRLILRQQSATPNPIPMPGKRDTRTNGFGRILKMTSTPKAAQRSVSTEASTSVPSFSSSSNYS